MIKFLDLHSQYLSIKQDVDEAISNVIRDSAFIGGASCTFFETAFATWCEVPFCVGVGNGTDALEIAIEALGLAPNSEIIVPGNSFISSAEAVTRSGHRVVFADVDRRTYTLDPANVVQKITPRTSAIIAVHLYGHPCDMTALATIAAQHKLEIVEDCAQAHGATFKGRHVGTFGRAATFSFYPGKTLGAYGDAGAVVTSDEGLAKRVRKIANHGRIGKYDHEFEGRNSRLDGLQAAILLAKLPHLKRWIEHRRDVAARYAQKLARIEGLELPVCEDWVEHGYHLFVVRTGRRDELADYLSSKDIQTGIHYPKALPKLQAYSAHGQVDEDMFVNLADRQLLSLPIGEHLSLGDVDIVSDAVCAFFGR